MAIGEDEMNPLDVIILRSQDIFSDSRVLRYEAWYKKIKLPTELSDGIDKGRI